MILDGIFRRWDLLPFLALVLATATNCSQAGTDATRQVDRAAGDVLECAIGAAERAIGLMPLSADRGDSVIEARILVTEPHGATYFVRLEGQNSGTIGHLWALELSYGETDASAKYSADGVYCKVLGLRIAYHLLSSQAVPEDWAKAVMSEAETLVDEEWSKSLSMEYDAPAMVVEVLASGSYKKSVMLDVGKDTRQGAAVLRDKVLRELQ